jgi:predicted transcriptional regulator
MSYNKKNRKEAVITFRYSAEHKKALQLLAELERTTASRIIQEAIDARLGLSAQDD